MRLAMPSSMRLWISFPGWLRVLLAASTLWSACIGTSAAAEPARRIVALAPHLTELVFAAGGGDRLVGVSSYSDFPVAARSIAKVGDAFAVNLEAIAALKPDLILTWRSGMGQRQRDRLRSLGLPVLETEIDSVNAIAATLRDLGQRMGTSNVADPAAERLSARWRELESRYARRRPLRVFYQLSDAPLITVGAQHLISHTIDACGGSNVFKSLQSPAPTVSWEAAALSNPQLIATVAVDPSAPHLGRWPELTRVDAVRLNQIALLPPDLLSRMGPRFVDGAELLCEAIDKARQAYPP